MFIEKLWKAARPFFPIQLYPVLAPIYWLRRRNQLNMLQEDDRRYLAAHPDLLVPSAQLRYNVFGPCTIPQFLDSGAQVVDDIESALQSVNMSLSRIQEFLDFGCGCGRLILALRNRGHNLGITASDVDARAIRWCQSNLEYSKCLIIDGLPPSPFKDGVFDLIWCGSVFTHLDKNRQDRWLVELRRILKPDGILIASVHGPHCWEPRLPKWTITKLRRDGIVFARTGADLGIHPGWYQVTWHTEKYIREHWGAILAVRNYIPRGLNNYQDVVVMQKES
jgi:SAM-dependent methyltransferase